jgi:tetratricopeptide (TPR) repeat protein
MTTFSRFLTIVALAVAAGSNLAGQPVPPLPPPAPAPPGAFAFDFQPDFQAQRAAEEAVRQLEENPWVGGDSYRAGQQALDRRQYERAITQFDRVIAAKSPRADGALYWKAYALNKLGRRDQALAALAELEKQFPQSRWLNDSRALAMEVRASTGQAASPESVADEDLKLLAINSLVGQEPDRAVPLLEKVLGDAKNPPSLKSRALFVLARIDSPRAREILTQYAKGASNPDLQMRAIEYYGRNRGADRAQMLGELYAAERSPEVKRVIIGALQSQGDARLLVDLARKETDAALKREIVERLSHMKSKEAMDYLMELLSK